MPRGDSLPLLITSLHIRHTWSIPLVVTQANTHGSCAHAASWMYSIELKYIQYKLNSNRGIIMINVINMPHMH